MAQEREMVRLLLTTVVTLFLVGAVACEPTDSSSGRDEDGGERTAATAQPTSTPQPTNTPAPQRGTREDPVPKGTVVRLSDGWEIRVDAVIPDATATVLAENQFNDPPVPGHQFFIATITATYQGQGSATFDGTYRLRAVGPSAVSYTTFENSCGVYPNRITNNEVFTGGTITGNVCWQVRSGDAAGLVLYDAPSTLTRNSERVFLSLAP